MKPHLQQNMLSLAAALFASSLVCGLLIFVLGENPLTIAGILLEGAFGSITGWCYTFFYATPLIFTGLAVAVAMWGGLFNIGAEGQLYIGALAAVYVGIAGATLSGWLLIPLCIGAAISAGGLWGGTAGYLKAKFQAHEVISTIMLNFIALGIVGWLASGPLHSPGDQIPQTGFIGEGARLPRISALFPSLPASLPLNFSFLLALIVAVWVWYLGSRTRFGLAVRAIGHNPDAARALGIQVRRTMILTMALAGALAGMVAVNEILGFRYRFLDNFSPGYGFTGIAVALLGRNHPAGIVAAAIMFGALMRGGLLVDIFSDTITKDLVVIFQGIIILAVVMESFWKSHIKKWTAS
jgi:general nucleoside transport system permease protein